MAFGVGQLVEDVDYTTVYNKISSVYGRNDGGYGQLMNSNPVADGLLIYASHWDDLRTYVVNARIHQAGSASLTDVGNTTIISYSHLSSYNLMADDCVSAKYTVASGQFTPDEAKASNTYTSSWGQQSLSNHVLTATCTVSGGDMNGDGARRGLRYFFNAGGKIKINLELSGYSAATDPAMIGQGKGDRWAEAFSSAGTIVMDYTQTSASSGTGSGIGGLDLTTSDQQIYTKSATGVVYSENYFRVWARFSDVSETAIIFTIKCYDLDTGDQRPGVPPLGPGVDEAVDGNLSVSFKQDRPSGSYVTVASPVYGAVGFSVGTS
jgi:hypothetical protein